MPAPVGRLRSFDLARDLDFYARSLVETYESNFPGFVAGEPFVEEMRAALVERLAAGTTLVLVWEAEGAPAGFVALGLRGSTREPYGIVEDVFVAPERRSTGIGAALMRAAEERVRSLGCTHLLLEVSVVNPGAVRLYRRLGYRTTRLQMEKPLRAGLTGVGRRPVFVD